MKPSREATTSKNNLLFAIFISLLSFAYPVGRDLFYPFDKERKTLVDIEEIGKPSKWFTLNCCRVLGPYRHIDLHEELPSSVLKARE